MSSRPFPWGTPSMTSTSTTLASSLPAIQWAAVAPTLPAPTMVTFLRMEVLSNLFGCRLLSVNHVVNHVRSELAGFDFGRARHQPLEIIGDEFLLNGGLHRALDQARGFAPAEVV